jgi:hypothetical protein
MKLKLRDSRYACSIATNEFTPDDLSAESLKDMFRNCEEKQERGIKLINTNLCAITVAKFDR